MYLLLDKDTEQYITNIEEDSCDFSDYPDQNEVQETAMFKTKKEALAARDKVAELISMDGVFTKKSLLKSFSIVKRLNPVNVTLSLNTEQLKSVISVLETCERRVDKYGSFGDGDTIYNNFAISKTIEQLKKAI